jgi:hypothetical protein
VRKKHREPQVAENVPVPKRLSGLKATGLQHDARELKLSRVTQN